VEICQNVGPNELCIVNKKLKLIVNRCKTFGVICPLGTMDQPTIVKPWNMVRLLGQVVCDVL